MLGAPNDEGGRSLCRPLDLRGRNYFRLVIVVRSAESLAIPVAPHQSDSNPPGLMSDVLTAVKTLEVLSLVNALHAPLGGLVSDNTGSVPTPSPQSWVVARPDW